MAVYYHPHMNDRPIRRDADLPIGVIAKAIGVHPNTVARWLSSGVLSGRKLMDIVSFVRMSK